MINIDVFGITSRLTKAGADHVNVSGHKFDNEWRLKITAHVNRDIAGIEVVISPLETEHTQTMMLEQSVAKIENTIINLGSTDDE